jgi:hypothetical protein
MLSQVGASGKQPLQRAPKYGHYVPNVAVWNFGHPAHRLVKSLMCDQTGERHPGLLQQ